jgi:hypothetical protein
MTPYLSEANIDPKWLEVIKSGVHVADRAI